MAHGPITNPILGRDPQSEEARGRFYGTYCGYVTNRDDPERRGRVQVWAPAVLPGERNQSRSWLDWCESASSGLDVPPLGAAVWIIFEDGLTTNGVYLPGITPEGEIPEAAIGGEDWPDARTYRTGGFGPQIEATLPADTARANPPPYPTNHVWERFGFRMEITEANEASGPRALIRHPSGTTLLIDADGRVQVRSEGGIFIDTAGDFTIGLRERSTFRVIRENGTGLVLGAAGFHVTGHAASLLGRAVLRVPGEIALWPRSLTHWNTAKSSIWGPRSARPASRSSFPSGYPRRRSTRPPARVSTWGWPT